MPTRLPFAGVTVGALGVVAMTGLATSFHPLAAQPVPASQVVADRMDHEEADMLARARAERDAAHAKVPAAHSSSDEQTSAAADDGEDVRRQAIEAEVRRRLEQAERQAELDQISERIRQAERARSGLGAPDGPRMPPPASSDPVADAEPPTAPVGRAPTRIVIRTDEPGSTRATVLLVMQPGREGIRRFNATADPILCTTDICYISRGPDRDAIAMPRRRALGPFNTLGRRAGACGASLECVFRNVEIGREAVQVQPIDLRLLRHDRRRPMTVHADDSCSLHEGRLVCSEPMRGPTWRVWVVPEPVARQAGGPGLRAALDAGLLSGTGTAGAYR